MLKQNRLKTIPLVILCGSILGGCANKKTWSPELEDAQNTYRQISQDQVVSSLAATELQAAGRQLLKAETASREFRQPHTVAHEAKLAKLKTLVAQQRARALSANHNLQLTIGQEPLLPEELILAAAHQASPEPTIAAARTDSTAANPDLAAQVAALTEQLASLQSLLLSNLAQPAKSSVIAPTNTVAPVQAPVATVPVLIPAQPAKQIPTQNSTAVMPRFDDVPSLGAAMAAPDDEATKTTSSGQLKKQLLAINAKPTRQGMALTMGERYFDQGSARLWNDRAARHLDNVTAMLNAHPDLTLDIEAHTDNSIGVDESYQLSGNRADSIKTALIQRGISEERINARGLGQSRPVARNSTPLDRLRNRRVELIFPDTQW